MPPEKIKLTMDYAKLLMMAGGICTAIWYAGHVDQKVTTIQEDIKDIKKYIYPQNIQDAMNERRAEYNRNVKVKQP